MLSMYSSFTDIEGNSFSEMINLCCCSVQLMASLLTHARLKDKRFRFEKKRCVLSCELITRARCMHDLSVCLDYKWAGVVFFNPLQFSASGHSRTVSKYVWGQSHRRRSLSCLENDFVRITLFSPRSHWYSHPLWSSSGSAALLKGTSVRKQLCGARAAPAFCLCSETPALKTLTHLKRWTVMINVVRSAPDTFISHYK